MASSFSHITHESISANNRRSLESLREKVDLAEAGLRNARDQYEAEVVRQGKPVRCIFSGTFFVRRSSAEKWLAEAEHEFNAREAKNFQHVKAALTKLAAKKQAGNEGLLWPWIGWLGLGHLPGDIVVERENFTLYVPIVTGLLISVVLMLLLWLANW